MMLTMWNTLNCLKNYKNAQFIGFRIITRNSSKGLTNDIIFKNFDPEKHRKCSTAQIQLKILRFVGFGYIA